MKYCGRSHKQGEQSRDIMRSCALLRPISHTYMPTYARTVKPTGLYLSVKITGHNGFNLR